MNLSEYNLRFIDDLKIGREKKESAGVDCDKCHAPMVYKDSYILDSYPAKRAVICPICNYEGTKYE